METPGRCQHRFVDLRFSSDSQPCLQETLRVKKVMVDSDDGVFFLETWCDNNSCLIKQHPANMKAKSATSNYFCPPASSSRALKNRKNGGHLAHEKKTLIFGHSEERGFCSPARKPPQALPLQR